MKYSKQIRAYRFMKMLSFIVLIITLFYVFFKLFASMFFMNVLASEKYKIDEPLSFLIIGSDYREDNVNPSLDGARSDVLMVGTLTPENSRGNIEFNVVSIPRDNLAYIPCGPSENYYDKINASLSYGLAKNIDIEEGIDCTVKTVESMMNIDVDYYVMATFQGVVEMVDAIGGVEINSPLEFCEQDSEGNGYSEYSDACPEGSIHIGQGVQTMDGETALAYARSRHSTSDYDRNLRQQQVITAVVKKLLSNPDKYATEFIKVFTDNFYTNFSVNDIWNFINFATSLYNNMALTLSNGGDVFVDVKTSPYENTVTLDTGIVSNNDVTPLPITEYYDESTLETFEKDEYISRNYFTKEKLKIASNLLETPKEQRQAIDESIGIELSSYSLKATNSVYGSSYTYIDYNSLYYTSNLLRKSYGLPVLEPTFDYSAIGEYQPDSFTSYADTLAQGYDATGTYTDSTAYDTATSYDDSTTYDEPTAYDEGATYDETTTYDDDTYYDENTTY